MKFETYIIKYGHSRGIFLPMKIADALRFNIYDKLDVSIKDDNTLLIERKK